MKNSDQPAFPVSREICECSKIEEYPYGLTKREYIAIQAMQGLITGVRASGDGININEICSSAVLIADRLIKELILSHERPTN